MNSYEQEEYQADPEYRDGYRVGRGIGTLSALAAHLGWHWHPETWGEPNCAWQRGLLCGYYDRTGGERGQEAATGEE